MANCQYSCVKLHLTWQTASAVVQNYMLQGKLPIQLYKITRYTWQTANSHKITHNYDKVVIK